MREWEEGREWGESGERVGGEWGESGDRVGREWGESGERVGGESVRRMRGE